MDVEDRVYKLKGDQLSAFMCLFEMDLIPVIPLRLHVKHFLKKYLQTTCRMIQTIPQSQLSQIDDYFDNADMQMYSVQYKVISRTSSPGN